VGPAGRKATLKNAPAPIETKARRGRGPALTAGTLKSLRRQNAFSGLPGGFLLLSIIAVFGFFQQDYILLITPAYKSANQLANVALLHYRPKKLPNSLHQLNPNIMGNLLYIIAVILILIWALGFFGVIPGLAGNNLIHILLVIAIIAILLRVIRGGRVV
jgi:hypothetical protein